MLRNPATLALEKFDEIKISVNEFNNSSNVLNILSRIENPDVFDQYRGLLIDIDSTISRIDLNAKKSKYYHNLITDMSSSINVISLMQKPSEFLESHLSNDKRQALQSIELEFDCSEVLKQELTEDKLIYAVSSMQEALDNLNIPEDVREIIERDIIILINLAKRAKSFAGDFSPFWARYLDVSAKLQSLLDAAEGIHVERPWSIARLGRFFIPSGQVFERVYNLAGSTVTLSAPIIPLIPHLPDLSG